MNAASPFPVFAAVALLLLFMWWVGTRNGLISLRNHCREAWADIDTELKRRHDLIPSLVETVKGYAAHEKHVLDRLVQLRADFDPMSGQAETAGWAESGIVRGISQVLAVAEGYPALKADRHFLVLQQQLTITEDRIQTARRLYNGNVRDLNNRVEMFPSSLVASMAGIGKAGFFEVENLHLRNTAGIRI